MNKQETEELLEMAGVDVTQGKAKSLMEAAEKTAAKWSPSKGPNDTPGFILQVKNPKGGLRTIGWIMDKPASNSGTVQMVAGLGGKKGINLDNYDFTLKEGWGASAQKRQQDDMGKENEQERQKIKQKHPEALKAYDAWRAKGVRGSAAAKKAVDKGMP